jgi:hypothetical protein
MPSETDVREDRPRETRHSAVARWTFNLISLAGIIGVFHFFQDHVTQNLSAIGCAVLSLTLYFTYRGKFNQSRPERLVTMPAAWQRKPAVGSDVQRV